MAKLLIWGSSSRTTVDAAASRREGVRPMARALFVMAILCAIGPAMASEEAAIRTPTPSAEPGHFIIKLKKPLSAYSASESSLFRRLNLVRVRPLPFIDAAVYRSTTNEEIGSLEAKIDSLPQVIKGEIEYIEPDFRWYAIQRPNDPRFAQLWGLAKIEAEAAWDTGTGSDSTVVAVIDTGVDLTHPDLKDNLWKNPNEIPDNNRDDDANGVVDDIYGMRSIRGALSGSPADDNGHGTHVAGTIGAIGNNGVGVVGVNWRASIMSLKFLDSNGSGLTSDAIVCIAYAVRMNAKVMNNSWGGGSFSRALRDAIANAGNRGGLFVVAAGNDGSNNDQVPVYPSSYDVPNVLSVMATTSNDQMAYYSNYGAVSVDIGAPGSGILSTLPGGYGTYSGTSMAAPHVAGAAALVKSVAPSWSALELKAQLMVSSTKIQSLAGKSVTEGRLNLADAVSAGLRIVEPTSATTWIPNSQQTVKWQSQYEIPACATLTIEGSSDGGASYITLANGVRKADGSAAVKAPAAPTGSAVVRISCANTALATRSAGFVIAQPLEFTKPDSSTKWWVWSRKQVTWLGGATSGGDPRCVNVAFYVSRDGGVTFRPKPLATVANDGKASVRMPLIRASKNAVLKIQCKEMTAEAVSEAFRVRSWVPFAGAVLLVGIAAS